MDTLEVAYSRSSNKPLCRPLLQQRLRLLQIERVKAFRKPAVHRSQQFASLPRLALVAPEAREARCALVDLRRDWSAAVRPVIRFADRQHLVWPNRRRDKGRHQST